MSITTKTGDKGKSVWVAKDGKHELWKDDPMLEVIGEMDGLQSALGVVRAMVTNKDLNFMIKEIQLDLWTMSGVLAGYQEWKDEGRVKAMEVGIKKWERELPTVKKFVVPGETQVGARLHWCRAIARRGERRLVSLVNSKPQIPNSKEMLIYFNRLSDYLFMMARMCDNTSVK